MVHSATDKNPFEIIKGHPKIPLFLRTHESIFFVDEYVNNVQDAFQKVQERLKKAKMKDINSFDKKRGHTDSKENDQVLSRFLKARIQYLSSEDWYGEFTSHQKYYAKLKKRYYGPFQILNRFNETTYGLEFPNDWHIHNAFHASLFKPYKGEPLSSIIKEDPPKFEEDKEILVLERIHKHEDKT